MSKICLSIPCLSRPWFDKTMFVHVYQDHVNLIQFNPVWSNLIQFDPIWSNLIQLDPFWSKLLQISVIFHNCPEEEEQQQQQQQQQSNPKDRRSKFPRSKILLKMSSTCIQQILYNSEVKELMSLQSLNGHEIWIAVYLLLTSR